ncbi:cytochrome C [Desulfovibrio sulfodismutans]|uniref:Cytochrome C n=1 Tax=Desulfolutivibrio sulfodismutans TaxID=63561 RepID=A0A7K3NPG2_9BACT|nr:cytochrome c3 family protein [Desulfolutivibrio sulfodismutans]NDY58051.1 cytochrome C [Desulfolutivibrio sulfodismutans]QLA11841.1 cytochrome C [Desulfolutivibrio sulfodismutans DSM 3696]
MKRMAVAIFALGAIFCSSSALAAGHDVDCKDCHSVHASKGAFIFSVAPLAEQSTAFGGKLDPAQVDALCLGCHNDKSGITPIMLKNSHPTGVTPKKLKVPEAMLRKGLLTCVGCHDPHPSNQNYKYLTINTNNGKDMGVFCASCHPGQSDPATLGKAAKAPAKAEAGAATTPTTPPAPASTTPGKPGAPIKAN